MPNLKVKGLVTKKLADCQGCTQLMDINLTVDLDGAPVMKKVQVKAKKDATGTVIQHQYIITD